MARDTSDKHGKGNRTLELKARAALQPRVNGRFASPDQAKEASSGSRPERRSTAATFAEPVETISSTPVEAAIDRSSSGAAPTRKTVKRPHQPSRRTLVARVSKSIERELLAVDQLMSDHSGPEPRDAETERRARTLASLARTLRELTQIQQPSKQQKPGDDDAIPRDIDELRRVLGARLDALIADAKAACPDESGDAVDGGVQ